MVIIREARCLETLKCFYNEALDVFVFHCAGKKITIQYASPEQIASIFRKAQVKDNSPDKPRSTREKTYIEMATAVIDGTDTENFIWSSDVDTFFNACEELRQSRIGNIYITETQLPIKESKESDTVIIKEKINKFNESKYLTYDEFTSRIQSFRSQKYCIVSWFSIVGPSGIRTEIEDDFIPTKADIGAVIFSSGKAFFRIDKFAVKDITVFPKEHITITTKDGTKIVLIFRTDAMLEVFE